jgi:hypothetical protein
MKKLELTIVSLLVMLPLSPAAGQSFSLPAASQAHPDVLGIKLGVSTVEDVRSVLTGTGLALWVQESTTWLSGALTTGFGRIQIPNSEHVALMTGISRTFRGPANERCGPITTTCQDLQATFSAPPNAGTVLVLTRMIHFTDGPLTATVIQGLVDKYGQPGFRNSHGDNLVWAWAPDGSTMALNERHVCASQGVAMGRAIDESKSALQAGCAAMLFAIIGSENSVTKFETIYLIDHYGIVAADIKTRAFVAEGVATYEKFERDAAAKRSVPSEFSDNTTSTKASSAAGGGERDTSASRGGRPNVSVEPPITPKPAPSSSDVSSALLAAKAIVDGASYDSTRARQLQLSGDSATLAVLRAAYANRLDSARTYLAMALASPDTALRTSAAAILLHGGTKLGRASIWDHAYPWLDETLQLVVPRAPSDTTGPRQQIRIQASYWYGLSSVLTLKDQYRAMVNSRNCSDVLAVNDRIARTKEALMLGMRVHPPTVNQMLQNLAQFERQMPAVKRAFACQNF